MRRMVVAAVASSVLAAVLGLVTSTAPAGAATYGCDRIGGNADLGAPMAAIDVHDDDVLSDDGTRMVFVSGWDHVADVWASSRALWLWEEGVGVRLLHRPAGGRHVNEHT